MTTVTYVSGLLSNGSDGINHFLSVGANGTSAVDGLVALMEVKMLETPQRLTSRLVRASFFKLAIGGVASVTM